MSTYFNFIILSNNVGISALQLDLRLPQGMALLDAALTSRASSSHQATFNRLPNGDYRLLASSSTCKAFSGSDGAVLTLTLSGTPSGTGNLSNIMLASPTATCYSIDNLYLDFNTTGIGNVYTTVRIYGDGSNIIIVAPTNGTAQFVLPNGMSKTVHVAVGRNVYPTPSQGVVIVKMNGEVKKLRF